MGKGFDQVGLQAIRNDHDKCVALYRATVKMERRNGAIVTFGQCHCGRSMRTDDVGATFLDIYLLAILGLEVIKILLKTLGKNFLATRGWFHQMFFVYTPV